MDLRSGHSPISGGVELSVAVLQEVPDGSFRAAISRVLWLVVG